MGFLGKREEIFTDILDNTSILEHKVLLVDDRPIRCRPHALPYPVRNEIPKEIQKIVVGIVREFNSPYESPKVVIKKKDRSNRICVDYRKLNRITITNPELLTTAEDLFQKQGQCHFAKIDLNKAISLTWWVCKGDVVLKTGVKTFLIVLVFA